ncbi:RHTO0S02e12860g1_1 [Rhodotorula toruloides]|uniref:RHTO0S02e12860g1_1 n=1 Tax=Rhodotorula toruloides TaxID=5286 RepID=A0A061APG8_RHOTO|nr:RHTO0S02e12860g1_1 [Rhodotorula toruloides]
MTKTLEHSALFGSSSQIGSAIPDAFLAPATPRSSSSETELRLAFSAGAVRHGSPSPPVDFRQRNTQLRVWNALTARDSRSPAFRSRARASEAERVAADFWYIIKLTQGASMCQRSSAGRYCSDSAFFLQAWVSSAAIQANRTTTCIPKSTLPFPPSTSPCWLARRQFRRWTSKELASEACNCEGRRCSLPAYARKALYLHLCLLATGICSILRG